MIKVILKVIILELVFQKYKYFRQSSVVLGKKNSCKK